MPQKKDAVVKSAVKTSFLCSVGFVLLAVMMNLSWETNDDFGISLVLANIQNDYSPFQNKLLSQLISAIYHKAPILEWWLVFTLICIWAGLWALLYTVQRRFPRGLKWVVSLVMICAVWSGALVSMNFTRTSMAVAIGGCVLIAQGIFEAKGKTVSVFECVIGNLLLILGGMIRTESALLALGFLAVIVGFELLFYNNFRMSFLWIRKHFGKFLILLLTAFLLIGSIAANNLFLTTEEKEFWQYNILRSKIQDYQECYPTWDDATEKYEAMGLSEGEQNLLIKNWFSEDTKVYSEEVMKQIADLYQRNNFWSQLLPIGIKIILSSSMTWVMLVSGLLFVSWNKKQNWLPFALGVSVTLVLSLAFLWLGRLPPRVYDSMALAALCTMMFLVGRKIPAEVRIKQDRLAWVTEERNCVEQTTVNIAYKRKFAGFAWICGEQELKLQEKTMIQWCSTTLLMSVVCVCLLSFALFGQKLQHLSWPSVDTENKNSFRVAADYVNANRDKLYFFPIYGNPISLDMAYQMWEPRPVDYCPNAFDLGGWGARMPYKQAQLKENDIENPVEALIEKPNAYSGYYRFLLDFLQNHYDKNITASRVDDISDFSLVQYTKPVKDKDIREGTGVSADIGAFEFQTMDGENTWKLSGRFYDLPQDYEELYCNVTVKGTRYTYRLSLQEKNFFAGYFYGIPADFNPAEGNVIIFAKNTQGRYESLVKVA